VQGVYFRTFVARRANELGLTGHVRNTPDGAVEVWAEGETGQLQKLLDDLHTGPPAARVVSVTADWSESTVGHTAFRIRY
jgi:acylphosphatase